MQLQGIDIDQCLLWALGVCILTAVGYLSIVVRNQGVPLTDRNHLIIEC